jgi:hypothetical protein
MLFSGIKPDDREILAKCKHTEGKILCHIKGTDTPRPCKLLRSKQKVNRNYAKHFRVFTFSHDTGSGNIGMHGDKMIINYADP